MVRSRAEAALVLEQESETIVPPPQGVRAWGTGPARARPEKTTCLARLAPRDGVSLAAVGQRVVEVA